MHTAPMAGRLCKAPEGFGPPNYSGHSLYCHAHYSYGHDSIILGVEVVSKVKIERKAVNWI